jgi:hypothetical protein
VTRTALAAHAPTLKAIDAVATNVGEDIQQQILTRDAPLTKQAVIVLAHETPAV